MQEANKSAWVAHPWVAERQHQVRIGVQFMGWRDDWLRLRDQVQMAEELGFDAVWAFDHPMFAADCWTTLAALATTTRSMRLGSLVSCVYYRHPALLARMAVDIDGLSNGRLVLGLGIGDLPSEFEQMGLPFPSVRERQEVLEEAIQVIKGVLGTSPFTYQGKHVQVQQASISSPPVQQPSIPLLIAGSGKQGALRQVAHYADASNFGANVLTGGVVHIEDVERKCLTLDALCESFGRPASSVLHTHVTLPMAVGETHAAIETRQSSVPAFVRERFQSSRVAVTPQEAITYFRALVRAGMHYFIVGVWFDDIETLQLLGRQVIPALSN